MSIPRTSQIGPALAVRSHFFEFQPATDVNHSSNQHLLLAHELEVGTEYRVVVTTAGELYRYQLHDQVLVVGFENEAPLMRFVGKADCTSDLVGEKLDAAHVQSILNSAFQVCGVQPSFAQLVADRGAKPGYVLQLAAAEVDDNFDLQEKLRRLVERRLCENPGYAYARELRQLNPLSVESLKNEAAAARTSEYVAERLQAGQRLGDIKPMPLAIRNGRG